MTGQIFTGACTALVTPFKDHKINYKMLEKLLKHQLDRGIRTIILSGTTGESPTLTDEEKLELFRFSKEYVGSDCSIIAGTGSNCTQKALYLSEKAQQAGADGLLVVSPYYNKANHDGIYSHYWNIASNSSIPVIIYNVPSRTGLDIPVSVYQELSSIKNIAGVKEANPDIEKIGKIREMCDDCFQIWSGNDSLIVPVMAMGGIGVISVLANILPRETGRICSLALGGNYKEAAQLQIKLQPFIRLLFCDVNPIPVKFAMKCLDFDCGSCRLPLTELSDTQKNEIRDYIAQQGS